MLDVCLTFNKMFNKCGRAYICVYIINPGKNRN